MSSFFTAMNFKDLTISTSRLKYCVYGTFRLAFTGDLFHWVKAQNRETLNAAVVLGLPADHLSGVL